MKIISIISVVSVILTVETLGSNPVSVSPRLLGNLVSQPGGTANLQNIVITLKIDQAVKSIENLVFPSREERILTVVNLLKQLSTANQLPILTFLKAQKLTNPKLDYKSYWASNQITVQNADLSLITSLVNLLSNLGLLGDIRQQVYKTIQPIQNATAPVLGPVAGWGVNTIGAKTVWSQGIDGTGIVVGSIDTGVRASHSSLSGSYLGGPYAWLDPAGISPSIPTDNLGHGSHTTGIMVGANQIGVAKGAKWMACRGCNGDQCSVDDLLTCGQFMLCPYANGNEADKNCTKAPHIINNSWGGGAPGDLTFHNIIAAWAAAGIIPVFAIGNAGPGCGTAGSPGDDKEPILISVGGTDISNGLGYFSSKGPSTLGAIKPEISAPGDNIYSAWNATDDTYVPLTGTSMAAPHVSGVIALMLQKDPTLKLPEIQKRLFTTAAKGNPASLAAIPCGTTTVTSDPNNSFGSGIVDAVKSVNYTVTVTC